MTMVLRMSLRPEGSPSTACAMGHAKCLETGTSRSFATFAELIALITEQRAVLSGSYDQRETKE